jgi:hypothetical protein
MKKRCNAKTRQGMGTRCRKRARLGTDYCSTHTLCTTCNRPGRHTAQQHAQWAEEDRWRRVPPILRVRTPAQFHIRDCGDLVRRLQELREELREGLDRLERQHVLVVTHGLMSPEAVRFVEHTYLEPLRRVFEVVLNALPAAAQEES